MSKLTAKGFLKIMKESTWQHDSDKKDLYEKYYDLMRRTTRLFYGLDLSTKESLQGLGDKDQFETFIRETSREEIEARFKKILGEMDTAANELEQKHKKQTTKRYIGTGAIVLIAILSLVPAIWEFGSGLGWWVVSPSIGCLAVLIPNVYEIVFSLREAASDARKGEGASEDGSSPDSTEKPKRLKSKIIRICIYTVVIIAIIAVTLVCILIKSKATIIFNSDGGTPIEPIVVTQGDTSFSLPTPSKEGHSFVVWSLKPASEATEADYFSLQKLEEIFASKTRVVTLHAIYQLNEYWIEYGNGCTVEGFLAKGNDLIHLAKADAFSSKTGYNIVGLSTDPKATEPMWSCGQPAKNLGENGEIVTLFPVYKPISYTVTFLPNGDSGEAFDMQVSYGESFKIPQPSFSKTGFHCVGFAKEPNKTVPDYPVGESVSNLTATDGDTVTRYAVWALNTYIVKYDANGGTGNVQSVSKNGNEKFNLPSTDGFARPGHNVCLGWSTDENATVPTYIGGQEVENVTLNHGVTVTLYAVWEPHTYEVIYHLNAPRAFLEPTMEQPVTQVTFGKPYTFSVPKCDYFELRCWSSAAQGGKQLTDTQGASSTAWDLACEADGTEVHVYAQWQQKYRGTYISEANELGNIEPTGDYYIIKDISTPCTLTPIANFSGILNGLGHTLSNLNIVQNSTGDFGLFGVNSGTIQNLNILSCSITTSDPADHISGEVCAGLICGKNAATGILKNIVISQSCVKVDLGSINNNNNNYVYVGILCGYNNGGEITKCGVYNGCSMDVYAGTKLEGAACYVGGIAGKAQGGRITDVFSNNNHFEVEAKANWVQKPPLAVFVPNCLGHGRPRAYNGGLIGLAEGTTLTRGVSHDNNICTTVTRGCKCGTNKEGCSGSIIAKRRNCSLFNCYSEIGDLLFQTYDSSVGATKVNSEVITLAMLPADFKNNGWINDTAINAPMFVIEKVY